MQSLFFLFFYKVSAELLLSIVTSNNKSKLAGINGKFKFTAAKTKVDDTFGLEKVGTEYILSHNDKNVCKKGDGLEFCKNGDLTKFKVISDREVNVISVDTLCLSKSTKGDAFFTTCAGSDDQKFKIYKADEDLEPNSNVGGPVREDKIRDVKENAFKFDLLRRLKSKYGFKEPKGNDSGKEDDNNDAKEFIDERTEILQSMRNKKWKAEEKTFEKEDDTKKNPENRKSSFDTTDKEKDSKTEHPENRKPAFYTTDKEKDSKTEHPENRKPAFYTTDKEKDSKTEHPENRKSSFDTTDKEKDPKIDNDKPEWYTNDNKEKEPKTEHPANRKPAFYTTDKEKDPKTEHPENRKPAFYTTDKEKEPKIDNDNPEWYTNDNKEKTHNTKIFETEKKTPNKTKPKWFNLTALENQTIKKTYKPSPQPKYPFEESTEHNSFVKQKEESDEEPIFKEELQRMGKRLEDKKESKKKYFENEHIFETSIPSDFLKTGNSENSEIEKIKMEPTILENPRNLEKPKKIKNIMVFEGEISLLGKPKDEKKGETEPNKENTDNVSDKKPTRWKFHDVELDPNMFYPPTEQNEEDVKESKLTNRGLENEFYEKNMNSFI